MGLAVLTRKDIPFLKRDSLRGPRALDSIVVLITVRTGQCLKTELPYTDLIVRNWYRLMDDIANRLNLGFQCLLLLGGQGQEVLLLLLQIGWATSAPLTDCVIFVLPTFLLQEIGDILLGLHMKSESSRQRRRGDWQARVPSSWARSVSGPR